MKTYDRLHPHWLIRFFFHSCVSQFLTVVALIPLFMIRAETRGILIQQRDPAGKIKTIASFRNSYALVIGNSAYSAGWSVIPGVRDDIKEVKKALEGNGFQVIAKENLAGPELIQAFNDFINQYGLDESARLIFYFAGHGHTLKNYGKKMGYIVPTDAPLPTLDEKGFIAKAVDLAQFEVFARKIRARHALFIFDSCFSGTFFGMRSAVIPEHISDKTGRPVRQFITSGGADQQVPDESYFRRVFVKALDTGAADSDRDGYTTGTELVEYLQKWVITYTKGAQRPEYGKIPDPELDAGDFVFVSGSRNSEHTIRPDPTSTPIIDLSSMEAAKRDEEEKRKKITKEEDESRPKWDAWLVQMQRKYAEITAYDDVNIKATLKVAKYEEFLRAYVEDDPYSEKDDQLRAMASDRLAYWQKVARAEYYSNLASRWRSLLPVGWQQIHDDRPVGVLQAALFLMGLAYYNDARNNWVASRAGYTAETLRLSMSATNPQLYRFFPQETVEVQAARSSVASYRQSAGIASGFLFLIYGWSFFDGAFLSGPLMISHEGSDRNVPNVQFTLNEQVRTASISERQISLFFRIGF